MPQGDTQQQAREVLARLLVWSKARLSQATWTHLESRDLRRIFGLPETTFYKRLAAGKLPKPDFKPGRQGLVWSFTSISDWLRARAQQAKPCIRQETSERIYSL